MENLPPGIVLDRMKIFDMLILFDDSRTNQLQEKNGILDKKKKYGHARSTTITINNVMAIQLNKNFSDKRACYLIFNNLTSMTNTILNSLIR